MIPEDDEEVYDKFRRTETITVNLFDSEYKWNIEKLLPTPPLSV